MLVLPAMSEASLGPRPDEPMRLEARTTGPRTVIIALPGVGWRDLRHADMRDLGPLLSQAVVGLMPAAAPTDRDPWRTWVTLGAGRAAVGAEDLGHLRSWKAPGIQTDLTGAQQANEAASTSAVVCLLGDMLRFVGCPTALIGDEPGPPPRALGMLVIADRQGKVDRAAIGEEVRPSGGSLDRRALTDAVTDALLHCDVILLEIADIAAAEAETPPRDERDLPAAKARALHAADRIIGDTFRALSGYDAAVFLICPLSPGYADPTARTLTPVALWRIGDPGSAHQYVPFDAEPMSLGDVPGLLTSSSTRWSGLVSPADLAPTILTSRGVHPTPGLEWDVESVFEWAYARFGGRLMQTVPDADALGRLDRLDAMLTDRHRLRFPIVKWYALYALLILVCGLLLAVWWPQRTPRLAMPGLGMALVPMGLLLAPLAGPRGLGAHALVAVVVAAALALAASRLRPSAAGLAGVMLVCAGLVVGDALLGSSLMRRSVLGFGVMLGSRFYGIGNEYMGSLAGMTAVGLGALLECAPRLRWAAALAGSAVVLAIGLPFFGANWGGGLAAAAGLLWLWLFWRPRRLWRALPLAIVLFAAAVLVPIVLDLLRPPWERSHIGSSAAVLLAGHAGSVIDTLQRKIAMNWAVIYYAPWSLLFVLLTAAICWLLLRPAGPAGRGLRGRQPLRAGILGALIAGIAAMVVNDSGLVAGSGAVAIALGALFWVAPRTAEVGP